MAEKILSPGVFTNEKNLTYLPAGIAAIGAAIVGPTTRGPAFVPTLISSFAEYEKLFGGLAEDTYVPYAVQSYLRSASSVYVVRVLQEGGYSTSPIHVIHNSASVSRVVGVVAPTTAVGISQDIDFAESDLSAFTGQSPTGSFGFTLSSSATPVQALTGSANPASADSLAKVLGQSVEGSKNGYLYQWAPEYIAANLDDGSTVTFVTASASTTLNLSGSYGDYQPAATPYVTSQIIGSEKLELFKFYTLGDGTANNKLVKVSVVNTILPGSDPGSDYGSFQVIVRAYADTDKQPQVLETFSNLNLDPDSVNYISRRIGDRAYSVGADSLVTITGDYENVSDYIRVSVADAVSQGAITTAAKPFGFAAMLQTVSSSFYMPASSMVSNITGETATEINSGYNKKVHYGWNFSSVDNKNWLMPIPEGAIASGSGFNLDEAYVHEDLVATSTNTALDAGLSISGSTFAGQDVANVLKFTVPFQGGFDGTDPAIPHNVGEDILPGNVFGMDCSGASSPGSVAYAKGLGVLSNGDEYDINLLVAPGITQAEHSAVIDDIIETAETRQDTFAIVDPIKLGATPAEAIASIADSSLDTTYAATYWPWVKIVDTDKNKPVWVPPSATMPRVIANNDSLGYEWFAPAGLNRGGILDATDVERKLNTSTKDELYTNRINPIAAFPGQGISVWGQNTLAAKPSAFQSINVRRLLIALKKYIASASRYLVFENNTASTRARFVNTVVPYLETVQARQGVYTFKVVMDETNNPASTIDQKIMYGEIHIQPARAAEFIVLDFTAHPTGASFTNT